MRIMKLIGEVCRGREGVVLLFSSYFLLHIDHGFLQSWLIESVRDMPI